MSDRSKGPGLMLLSTCLLLLPFGAPASAQCTPTILVESVQYQGETVGPGGQKVDQFAVRWGTSKVCNLSGKATVVLNIKRLVKDESVSASNIDSSRTTGNLINLTISRGATETDPKSWTVVITHMPSAASQRSLRISGRGTPSFSTATVGPIPGGPIGDLPQSNPSLALGVGAPRKVAVVAGNLRLDSNLLVLQAITCLAGGVNITGLTHTAPTAKGGETAGVFPELVTIQYSATPPTCEKINKLELKAQFTRQDGTKQTPAIEVAGTTTSHGFALGNPTSPIASYFIDVFGHFQAAAATPVTVTKSGTF